MIIPGKKITVQVDGISVDARCLTEAQQLDLIAVLESISTIEPGVKSLRQIVTASRDIIGIVSPDMPEDERQSLGHNRIIELAGTVMAAHMIGDDTKKKSDWPRSSEQANCVKAVAPDVLVASVEY